MLSVAKDSDRPTARSSHGFASAEGKLYVHGGEGVRGKLKVDGGCGVVSAGRRCIVDLRFHIAWIAVRGSSLLLTNFIMSTFCIA